MIGMTPTQKILQGRTLADLETENERYRAGLQAAEHHLKTGASTRDVLNAVQLALYGPPLFYKRDEEDGA